MDFSSLLMFGGIAVMVCAVIAGIVLFFAFKARTETLNHKMDQEYGTPDGSATRFRSKEKG